MAQAILIMAHRDFDHLLDIMDWFDDDFEFYIHIDRKFKPNQDVMNRILSEKKVRFVSTKYSVNWERETIFKPVYFWLRKHWRIPLSRIFIKSADRIFRFVHYPLSRTLNSQGKIT